MCSYFFSKPVFLLGLPFFPCEVDSSTAPHSVTTASNAESEESALNVRDNGEPGISSTDGKKKKDFLDAAVSAMGKSPRTILKHAGKVVGSPRMSRKGATGMSKPNVGTMNMPTYNRHSLLGMKMAQREESYTYKERYRWVQSLQTQSGRLDNSLWLSETQE